MQILKLPRLYHIGMRFPLSVLLVSLSLSFLSLIAIRNLKIQNDLISLLPKGMESVKSLHQAERYFGGLGHLIVTVEGDDRISAEGFADLFAQRIETHPAVQYVDHRRPVEFFKKRKWLYLDFEDLKEVEGRVDRTLELQKKGVSPLFSRLMDFAEEEDRPDLSFDDLFEKHRKGFGTAAQEIVSSEDGEFLVLRVKLRENPENFDTTKRLVADFKEMEGEVTGRGDFPGVSVGYTGSYQKMAEQADQIRREIGWVSVVVSVLLFLVLLLYFRRVLSAVFVGLPVTIGVLWTGGVVSLFPGHLNLITSFAAAILAGLGSDYGIYLLTRYEQERGRGHDPEEASRLAFSMTGKATLASMLTTAGAFAALLFSYFSLFTEFGMVGALGIFLNYIAMVLILPALLTLKERWSGVKFPRPFLRPFIKDPSDLARHTTWKGWSYLLLPKGASYWVFCFVLLCGVAALTLPTETRIHFEDGHLENKRLASFRLDERVGPLVGASLNPTLLLVEGSETEEKTVRTLQRLLEEDGDKRLVFNQAVGLSSFVPPFQAEKKVLLRRVYEKISRATLLTEEGKRQLLSSFRDSLQVPPISRDSLPREVRRMFESGRRPDIFAVYLNPAFGRVSAESMKRYHEGIVALKKEVGVDFTAADGTFINNDIVRLIRKEAPPGMILVLLFLGGVVALTVRSWKRGVVIFANLLGSLILLSGLLWLLGVRLNIVNMAVIPVILGTGIDCFLHLNHRFDENGLIVDTLYSKIPPILVSNATTMIGFGGLILTSSVGLRSAGGVAVLGILIMTIVCVFIFPRCLSLQKESFQSPK